MAAHAPNEVHKKQRLNNIDALRALSIVGVALYHYTSRLEPAYLNAAAYPFTVPWGWLGVDIFFVLSGYCVLMTLESASSIGHFFAKRLARLQPAYVTAIVCTMALTAIFGLPGRDVGWLTALSNMLWLNAIPGWPMVDAAFWTLVVELKFYFWLAVVYQLVGARHLSITLLAFTTIAIVGQRMATFLGAHQLPGAHTGLLVSEQLLIAPYMPAFMLGTLAYLRERVSPRTQWLLFATTLTLAAMSPRYFGILVYAIPILVGTYVVLLMPQLALPIPIARLGLVSYSFYLIHQNPGYILLRELAPFVPSYTFRMMIVFTILIGGATALFYAVEVRWQRQLTAVLKGAFESLFNRAHRVLRTLRH